MNSTADKPRIGDRFQISCHDTAGVLVNVSVTADRVVASHAFPGRYRIEAARPGPTDGNCPRLAFVVDVSQP